MSGVLVYLGDGLVEVHSQCFGCKRVFAFHPNKVPSCPVNGTRQPICQTCVDVVNPRRVAGGLDPIVVKPGAYGPAFEHELDLSNN